MRNNQIAEREISMLTEKLNKEVLEKEEIKKQMKSDHKRKIEEVTMKLKEENLQLQKKLHQSVEESFYKMREAQNNELKAQV